MMSFYSPYRLKYQTLINQSKYYFFILFWFLDFDQTILDNIFCLIYKTYKSKRISKQQTQQKMEGINKLSNQNTVRKQQSKNYGSKQNTENLQSIVNQNLKIEIIQHQKFLKQLILKLKNSPQSNQISRSQTQRLRIAEIRIQLANFDPSTRYNLRLLLKQLQSLLKKAKVNQSTLSTSNLQHHLNGPNGPNFMLEPFCCRTYFFNKEKIISLPNSRTTYSPFPFKPGKMFRKNHKSTLKKIICEYLNNQGGWIYFGINLHPKKYAFVRGQYITQNDKQEILKDFRKLKQQISPDFSDIQIQFVPIRQNPIVTALLLDQQKQYYYDFSDQAFDADQYPYFAAWYVIKVIIPRGKADQMYSYTEQQEDIINQAKASTQFISLNSGSEIQQISQYVLKKFRSKLLKQQQQKPQSTLKPHEGLCKKAQIGQPKNQPQVGDYGDYTDVKDKQQQLKMKALSQNKKSKDQAYYAYNDRQNNQQVNFYVSGKQKPQKILECFHKTPATSQYARIKQFDSQIIKDSITIITISGQCPQRDFESIKTEFQFNFNPKDSNLIQQRQNCVRMIQVSHEIAMYQHQQRRIIQMLIKQRNDKCIIECEALIFQSLETTVSYFSFIERYTLFKVESILF